MHYYALPQIPPGLWSLDPLGDFRALDLIAHP